MMNMNSQQLQQMFKLFVQTMNPMSNCASEIKTEQQVMMIPSANKRKVVKSEALLAATGVPFKPKRKRETNNKTYHSEFVIWGIVLSLFIKLDHGGKCTHEDIRTSYCISSCIAAFLGFIDPSTFVIAMWHLNQKKGRKHVYAGLEEYCKSLGYKSVTRGTAEGVRVSALKEKMAGISPCPLLHAIHDSPVFSRDVTGPYNAINVPAILLYLQRMFHSLDLIIDNTMLSLVNLSSTIEQRAIDKKYSYANLFSSTEVKAMYDSVVPDDLHEYRTLIDLFGRKATPYSSYSAVYVVVPNTVETKNMLLKDSVIRVQETYKKWLLDQRRYGIDLLNVTNTRDTNYYAISAVAHPNRAIEQLASFAQSAPSCFPTSGASFFTSPNNDIERSEWNFLDEYFNNFVLCIESRNIKTEKRCDSPEDQVHINSNLNCSKSVTPQRIDSKLLGDGSSKDKPVNVEEAMKKYVFDDYVIRNDIATLI